MGVRVVAVVLPVLLLGGCASPAAPAVSLRPTAVAPASDTELARFAAVAQRVVDAHDHPGGMAFVRALEAAGWPRHDLQVTADRTSVGLDVPAVQFAARDGKGCLLGQYGSAGLRVLRAQPVDGACLIGDTRDLG